MTQYHQSYGKYTKEQIQDMTNAPYGRNPLYGIENDSIEASKEQIKKFKIYVSRIIPVTETATVEIEAFTEEEAEKIIEGMDWDDFNWSESDKGYPDDYEISYIEEI